MKNCSQMLLKNIHIHSLHALHVDIVISDAKTALVNAN